MFSNLFKRVLLTALISFLGATAKAEDIQANTYTTGDQRNAHIAVDSQGNMIVIWDSEGSTGSDQDGLSVQGRRFDSNGLPLSDQFQVNSYTLDHQGNASVASDASGNFFVVWESLEGEPDNHGNSVHGRRYASDGTPLGGQFQVNTHTLFPQQAPDVAVANDGRAVAVWRSLASTGGSDTSLSSIRAQRYSANGSPVGGEFQINSYTPGKQNAPAIAIGEQGDFVVVWDSESAPGDPSYSIQGQRFDSNGAPLGNEFRANTHTTEDQRNPAVAMTGNGSFIVAWHGDSSAGTDSSLSSIQARRYGSNGAPLGPEFQVNSYTPSAQRNPSIAANPDGSFAVLWTSFGSSDSDNSNNSIQAQRYASNGSPLGDQFQVNTYTLGAQTSPSVAPDVQGDLVAAWGSDGSVGTDTDGFSIQLGRASSQAATALAVGQSGASDGNAHFPATPIGITATLECLGACFTTGGSECNAAGIFDESLPADPPFENGTFRRYDVASGESCLEGEFVTFPVALAAGEAVTTDVTFTPTTTSQAVDSLFYVGDDAGLEWSLVGGSLSVDEFVFTHPSIPEGEPIPLEFDTTIAGNPVTIAAQVRNTSLQDATAVFEITEEEDTLPTIPKTPLTHEFAANEVTTVEAVWDTTGLAWDADGMPDFHTITAALTDSAGNLYDSSSTNLNINPRPVILVHGWRSDSETWNDYLGEDGAPGFLKMAHPGWRGFAPDLPTSDGTSYEELAEKLDDFVADVRETAQAQQVDIVAHSMGGIISRAYIHARMGKDINGRPIAKHLFTLGTPHKGTECADLPKYNDSQKLLTEARMTNVNKSVTNRRGVAFSALVGNGHSDMDCNGLALFSPYPGPSDGVVPVVSARHAITDVEFTSTDHTDMTGSSGDFQTDILPRLNGTEQVQPILVKASIAEERNQASDDILNRIQAIYIDDYNDGTQVGPFQTKDITVFVPGDITGISIMAAAFHSTIELLDPAGSPVPPRTGREGEMHVFSTDSVQAGDWTIRIKNTSDETVDVDAAVTVWDYPLKLRGQTSQLPDNAWHVTATLTDSGAPITGATVKATVNFPPGLEDIHLTLYDDGAHNDGLPDDGVYGGTIGQLELLDHITGVSGHTVVISATGFGEGITLYDTPSILITSDIFQDSFESGDTSAWDVTVGI